jgi:hypothetical protein
MLDQRGAGHSKVNKDTLELRLQNQVAAIASRTDVNIQQHPLYPAGPPKRGMTQFLT